MDRAVATDKARALLRELKLEVSDLPALQAVPQERLLAAANAAVGAGLADFAPVVDGRLLPRHPWTPDAPEFAREVPMLIGSTKDEATLFSLLAGGADAPEFKLAEADLAPRLATTQKLSPETVEALVAAYRADAPEASPSDVFFMAVSQAGMGLAAVTQAERKATQTPGGAYVYLTAWESPAMGGRLRAAHSVDVPFVFNNPDSQPLNGSGPDLQRMAGLMSRAWAAFARTGDPNHDGLPHWPPYDPVRRPTLIFKLAPEVLNDPFGRSRALLQKDLPA
jgi:para-nitrobenzyl esterase